jgi:signal peptidase II
VTPRSIVIVGALVIFDQAAKFFVSANLKLHESLAVIKDVFHITLIHNRGAAFGIFKGMLPVFIFLSVVTVFLIILCANRFRHTYYHVRTGLLLILAGAIGNLIDRLRFGYVIDFIDLRIWPVFNIADMTITIGGIFLVLHILFMPQKHKT